MREITDKEFFELSKTDSVKVEFDEVGVKILLIEYANLTRKD